MALPCSLAGPRTDQPLGHCQTQLPKGTSTWPGCRPWQQESCCGWCRMQKWCLEPWFERFSLKKQSAIYCIIIYNIYDDIYIILYNIWWYIYMYLLIFYILYVLYIIYMYIMFYIMVDNYLVQGCWTIFEIREGLLRQAWGLSEPFCENEGPCTATLFRRTMYDII